MIIFISLLNITYEPLKLLFLLHHLWLQRKLWQEAKAGSSHAKHALMYNLYINQLYTWVAKK
jgi:hypothetical protein